MSRCGARQGDSTGGASFPGLYQVALARKSHIPGSWRPTLHRRPSTPTTGRGGHVLQSGQACCHGADYNLQGALRLSDTESRRALSTNGTVHAAARSQGKDGALPQLGGRQTQMDPTVSVPRPLLSEIAVWLVRGQGVRQASPALGAPPWGAARPSRRVSGGPGGPGGTEHSSSWCRDPGPAP